MLTAMEIYEKLKYSAQKQVANSAEGQRLLAMAPQDVEKLVDQICRNSANWIALAIEEAASGRQ